MKTTALKAGRARISMGSVLRLLLSMALMGAAAAIVYVVPKLIGSSWTDIWGRIGQIGLGTGLVILGCGSVVWPSTRSP